MHWPQCLFLGALPTKKLQLAIHEAYFPVTEVCMRVQSYKNSFFIHSQKGTHLLWIKPDQRIMQGNVIAKNIQLKGFHMSTRQKGCPVIMMATRKRCIRQQQHKQTVNLEMSHKQWKDFKIQFCAIWMRICHNNRKQFSMHNWMREVAKPPWAKDDDGWLSMILDDPPWANEWPKLKVDDVESSASAACA